VTIAIMIVAMMLLVISAVAVVIPSAVVGGNDAARRHKKKSDDGSVSGDALQRAHRDAPVSDWSVEDAVPGAREPSELRVNP
jgi:hypothetical protein